MTTSTSPVTVDDLLANAAWARRLALNLMSDRDQADDLVQETWIAALRAQPDRSQSLRPWLARVLRNRAANRSRDAARREVRHDRAADLVEAAAAADPEELLSRMQVQRLLAELITGLREPARQTVLLRFYEGLTSEQIGEAMGVAPGTVRRRLKEAVDELRDELDRRHGGNRDTWLLALLPLDAAIEPDDQPPATTNPSPSPPPVTARRRELPAAVAPLPLLPKLAIGAAALALAAGALFLAWPAGQSPPPDGRGSTTAASGGDRPGAGNPWLAAALPLTLDQCRDTLAARRRDLAPLEAESRRNEKPEDLYDQQTTPNPTARAALLPDLERALRGDAAAGRSFTLDCRTLACRMVTDERPDDSGRTVGVWLRPLRDDPALGERVFRYTYAVGMINDRENPSAKLVVAFLRLKDPSGARIAGTDLPGLPAAASKPLPANLEACRVELDVVERRIAFLKASNEHALSLFERFGRSPPNPALAAKFGAVVAGALQTGGVGAKAEVVCRGRVCQVSAPGASSGEWLGALQRNEEVQRYRLNFAFTPADGKVFYEVGDPQRPDGRKLLVRLHFEILRSAGMKACGTRFAAKGQIPVKFVVPDGESPQPGADPRRITAHLGGPLLETPLGHCVEEELTRIVESIPLPPGVKGATVNDRIEFPLVEPPMRPRRPAGTPAPLPPPTR